MASTRNTDITRQGSTQVRKCSLRCEGIVSEIVAPSQAADIIEAEESAAAAVHLNISAGKSTRPEAVASLCGGSGRGSLIHGFGKRISIAILARH